LKNNHLAIDSVRTAGVTGNGREHLVLDNYLINGLVFPKNTRGEDIWPNIEKIQKQDIPFNWIFMDRIYLTPRKAEHEIVEEFPGFLAAIEIAGKIIVEDSKEEDNKKHKETPAERVKLAFGKLSYTLDEMLEIVA